MWGVRRRGEGKEVWGVGWGEEGVCGCVQLPMPSVMQAPLLVNVQYCGGGGGLADPGGAGGEKRLYGLPEVTVHSCCDVVDAQIWKPPRVTEPSERQAIVSPARICTLSGPLPVPRYCVVPIVT